MALDGDTAALRLCLERIIPPIRAKDDPVLIPGLKGTLTEQAETVVSAMSAGAITPAEANAVLTGLAAQARIAEIDELEKRISKLEELNA
jgi:hypothetical protein